MRMKAWVPVAVVLAIFAAVAIPYASAQSQDEGKLRVAVTLPDIVPIVEAIGGDAVEVIGVMPPMADPHGYSLTADALQSVQSCDLLVFGNSGFLHFEEGLAETVTGIDTIDWPDYERHGAALKDFPGFESNPHGFWLGFRNARAIAAAVAEALIGRGVEMATVTSNLVTFTSELDALEDSGLQLMEDIGRPRSQWVAAVPGVAYIIGNLGFNVGYILLEEEAAFASGAKLREIQSKLISGELRGIVCPLSMRGHKPGEIAEQIAADTGADVCYVRFLHTGEGDSFLSQAAYNAGVLAAAASRAERAAPLSRRGTSNIHLIWAGVVFALLILLVIENRRVHQAGRVQGAGIFEKKGKDKRRKR